MPFHLLPLVCGPVVLFVIRHRNLSHSVAELQRTFIDYHRARREVVAGDREPLPDCHTAPCELLRRRRSQSPCPAHEIDVEAFVRYLGTVRVAPNGHAHTRRRPLRDNGVYFILTSMWQGFSTRTNHIANALSPD